MKPVTCCLILAVALLQGLPRAAEELPSALSDRELWSMASDFSEPDGTFRSENLVSNELHFVQMILAMARFGTGGVYVGVGPEQNFSYIAALRPKMAFIVDVRRENRNLHLMYKALFELSTSRVDFVSRLFSRPRPEGVGPHSTVDEIFSAYADATASKTLFDENLRSIRDQLVSIHRFPLAPDDLRWVEHVLDAFYSNGPSINYRGCQSCAGPGSPDYVTLMTARDVMGQTRSYLASEESFTIVKDLQTKNLIVPVVGNFAGLTTIRAVGQYLRDRGERVSVFYGSNVAEVLTRLQLVTFCRSLATLPVDARSLYIGGATRGRGFGGFHAFTPLVQTCISGKP